MEVLIEIVRNARLGDGTVEVEKVFQALSRQFVLKDHPSYAASWDALETNTAVYKKNIETALPNKFVIDRTPEVTASAELISNNAVSAFYGDSGTGKTALIQTVLDQEFPEWRQVWLGPDQLTTALGENERAKLGLTHALTSVLKLSSKSNNVLVIDAAERLPREVQNEARNLVTAITKDDGSGYSSKWRVVIVGQTEAWVEGAFQTIAGTAEPANREIRAVSANDIKSALRSMPRLSWASSHDKIITVLSNLRALA